MPQCEIRDNDSTASFVLRLNWSPSFHTWISLVYFHNRRTGCWCLIMLTMSTLHVQRLIKHRQKFLHLLIGIICLNFSPSQSALFQFQVGLDVLLALDFNFLWPSVLLEHQAQAICLCLAPGLINGMGTPARTQQFSLVSTREPQFPSTATLL